MSDKSDKVSEKGVRFARSATKHRISKECIGYPRSASDIQGVHRISKECIRYVITHCGLVFEEPASSSSAEALDERLLCLGDDAEGKALEVMAVEGSKGELVVIHAMELRAKYRDQYEEAKQWRL
jgi:hypothetical protein